MRKGCEGGEEVKVEEGSGVCVREGREIKKMEIKSAR